MDTTSVARAQSYEGAEFAQVLTPHPSVVGRLLEWAHSQPDATYMTAVSLDGRSEVISYGELERQTRRLAGWLRHDQGLRPGDIVALMPANDLPSVLTLVALMRAGCATFCINPAEPPGRMLELLGGLDIRVVLSPHRRASTPDGAVEVPPPSTLPALSPEFEDLELAPEARAFYIATSGSTATSKIVSQAHYNAAINAEGLRRHHALGPGVKVLGCLPIHHVNGLHFTVLGTLWSGAHAILLESFKPNHFQNCLLQYRPNIASVVPNILETLLFSWTDTPFPAEFQYFVTAAAPLSASISRRVLQVLGVRVLQGYGLSETTNFSTKIPRDLSDETYRRVMIEADIPSIGVAFYGNQVAVLREDGSHAVPGEVGEICMRGHNVMLGYTNQEATAEAFEGGWFHSRDLGYELCEGGHSFFVITGRSKNMVKIMGKAVSLEEMERTLMRAPGVRDVACFSEPYPLLGEAIIAVVVAESPIDPKKLNLVLQEFFEATALPRRYVQVASIPRTITGKLMRAQLAQLHGRGGAVRKEG